MSAFWDRAEEQAKFILCRFPGNPAQYLDIHKAVKPGLRALHQRVSDERRPHARGFVIRVGRLILLMFSPMSRVHVALTPADCGSTSPVLMGHQQTAIRNCFMVLPVLPTLFVLPAN